MVTNRSYATGTAKLFWKCPRYPLCDYVCSAHPDGRPMGVPADAATRKARARLHRVFDPLWQTGLMSRTAAYHLLAAVTGRPFDRAHVALFDLATCEAAAAALLETFADFYTQARGE